MLHGSKKKTTLPKTNIAPTKWMVGIQAFPIGEAYFQGRLPLVSGRVLDDIQIQLDQQPITWQDTAALWRFDS